LAHFRAKTPGFHEALRRRRFAVLIVAFRGPAIYNALMVANAAGIIAPAQGTFPDQFPVLFSPEPYVRGGPPGDPLRLQMSP